MSELGPEAKELLDFARGADDPSADDRSRVRSAVGARIALGAAAGAAVTAAASSSAAGAAATASAVAAPLGLGMKLLFAIGAATAVGVGAVSYVDSKAPAPSVGRNAPAIAPSAPPRAPAAPSASIVARSPIVVPSAKPEPPAEPEPPAAPTVSVRVAPASAPTTTASAVQRELELLREAHAAIQSGDGARALILLDEHARRFPSGALGEEREAARIFALCTLGRTSEARAAAERFLRAFPSSMHAARVRSSCASAGAPF